MVHALETTPLLRSRECHVKAAALHRVNLDHHAPVETKVAVLAPELLVQATTHLLRSRECHAQAADQTVVNALIGQQRARMLMPRQRKSVPVVHVPVGHVQQLPAPAPEHQVAPVRTQG